MSWILQNVKGILAQNYLRAPGAVEGFLTRWVTGCGWVVAKRALEQWYLLEAASTGLRGRLLMHHHVLSESPLHAGQHFDEVLLRQSTDKFLKSALPTEEYLFGIPINRSKRSDRILDPLILCVLHHYYYHLIHCIRCFVTLCTKAPLLSIFYPTSILYNLVNDPLISEYSDLMFHMYSDTIIDSLNKQLTYLTYIYWKSDSLKQHLILLTNSWKSVENLATGILCPPSGSFPIL